MRWMAQLRMLFQMLFKRGKAGARLDEELQFHIERQVAENIASGMNVQEARYAALRAFGNPSLLREQTRTTWSWNWLESLLRDLRIGARTLLHAPGFAVIAILVMALGIGANIAMFTVVRGVLLKPLPFKDPDRLLMLYERGLGGDLSSYNVVAGGIYSEWKKQNTTFSNLALMVEDSFAMAGAGGQLPEKIQGAQFSWDMLDTLGLHPALGRNFTAADDTPAANGTVLLSWSLWKRRFSSDRSIVGRSIYLNGKPYTVIGVMPEWFAFPAAGTQLWTSVYHDRPEKYMVMLDSHGFRVVGRPKPGVSPEQATADLSAISLRLHNAHLDNPFIFQAANSRPLLLHMVRTIRQPLYVLLAATGCVLLIACLNVANLLVARAASRRKELAIRTALGGGWLRLLRERMMESLLLTVAGGAGGLVIACAALQWLTHTRQDMSRVDDIHIDTVVAAFTVGIIVLCALFSGLISALSANDKQILSTLHESSRGYSGSTSRTALRRTLLSLEVGLTVVLLIGAGLLLKSYQRLRSADVGCITQNVLTMRIALPEVRYQTPALRIAFFEALLARVRALPGVQAAGFVEAVPGQGYWEDSSFTVVEHPPLPQGKGLYALNRTADSGYFAAMGIPLLRGRTFNPAQRLDHANEIVISNGFVRRYFPNEEPLGKHLHTNNKDYTVVGVVGDTRYELGEDPMPTKYFPIMSGEQSDGALVIRSTRDVEQLALPVQRVIQELDHDLAVSDVMTMDQLLGKSTLDESFSATLLVAFAGLSLLLAAVGLFGVLSYVVAQRTSEIGIRIALGAQREQVLRRMLLDGLRPALFGLGFGLIASAGATRLLGAMLYQTQPLDPAVFAAVTAMLLLVAALACMAPAWRASRLDPMQALRTE